MVVHIVMAACIGDSYHSIILATLDKEEALEVVNDYNRRHRDPYDIQYEIFTLPLKGLPETRREIVLARIEERGNSARLDEGKKV